MTYIIHITCIGSSNESDHGNVSDDVDNIQGEKQKQHMQHDSVNVQVFNEWEPNSGLIGMYNYLKFAIHRSI